MNAQKERKPKRPTVQASRLWLSFLWGDFHADQQIKVKSYLPLPLRHIAPKPSLRILA